MRKAFRLLIAFALLLGITAAIRPPAPVARANVGRMVVFEGFYSVS